MTFKITRWESNGIYVRDVWKMFHDYPVRTSTGFVYSNRHYCHKTQPILLLISHVVDVEVPFPLNVFNDKFVAEL